MTKKPYVVNFSWPVYVWAECEDEAEDLASRYGEDEAGFGENFDKLAMDVTVPYMGPIYPRLFLNPEDEPEEES